MNTGISEEFPDNIRIEEYRRTDFPIIKNNLGISNSVNVYRNNINNIKPELITQKNMNRNNISNFMENKSEKLYCCGKCSKKACIITIIIVSIILLLNIISMIVSLSMFSKSYK